MAETLEELSYDYEDEGELVRRELKKEILTRGVWSTVMFLYEEFDRKTSAWRAPKIAIVRFKKAKGVYRKQSAFNVSSEKQARQLIDVMTRWYAEIGSTDEAERSESVGVNEAAAEGEDEE